MLSISNQEARQIVLNSQGLLGNLEGQGKADTLKVIEHLGYVQIDTISVVERAHHHVLWSRTKDYKKEQLDELLEKDKSIFEYWSHAAAYLPMRDFRYSLIRKNLFANRKLSRYANKKIIRFVYDRIKAEGALQSKDFEEKKKQSGWWEWKDSKRALEQLFMEGELMVAGRKGFQKVYDLTERVLPAVVDTRLPDAAEYGRYLIEKAVRANGIVGENEIGYLRSYTKKSVAKMLGEMEEDKTIAKICLENNSKEAIFTSPQVLQNPISLKAKKAFKILSPFDNCVIQRNRLKRIFNFDYTIECYVPAPKRKYGYFCLPLLYADKFVGRVDCKAERKEKILYVHRIFTEAGFRNSNSISNKLNQCLQDFAGFNGCKEVVVKGG